MSTFDNSRVSAAETTSQSKLRIYAATAELWVNGQRVWEKDPTMGGQYLSVDIATFSNIAETKLNSGAESLHGSEYAQSQKGSTRRKATRKGKK